MWRFLICHCLLWLGVLSAKAQVTDPFFAGFGNELEVFPVRVNHKTGYARFYNTREGDRAYVMVEPRYDYIMEDFLAYHGGDLSRPIASPYRLFETDEKVGILNRRLEEVLPARFNRIRILGDHLFAIEESDKEGFALMDTSGQMLLGASRFEDIHAGGEAWTNTSPRFIFFKKNGLWGVCLLSGEVIIPPEYTEIRSAGLSGYFKVKTISGKGLWQAVDSIGNTIIQQPLEDLLLLGSEMFLAFDGIYWQRLHPEGRGVFRMGSERFLHVEKLNNAMAILVTQTDDRSFAAALWRVHERPSELKKVVLETSDDEAIQELITKLKSNSSNNEKDWFFPLDENLVFQKPSGNGITLIDSEGNESRLPYRWIQTSGFPGVYKIWNTSFGLYHHLTKKVLISPSFNGISNFQGRLAAAYLRGESHLLGLADSVLVQYPTSAGRIFLQEGNRATLHLQSTSISVSFLPDGVFEEEIIQTRMMRVSSNADRPLIEAPTVEKVPLLPYRGTPHKTSPVVLRNENNAWIFFKPPGKEERQEGATREIWKVRLPPSNALWKGEEVISNKIAALFYRGAKYLSPLLSSYEIHQSIVRLYDLEKGQFFGDSTMLGFRRFDSLYQYTAFMDKHGRMGLIDRKGRELLENEQPIRYTYIGRFVAGRARVAIGGKLAINYPEPLDVPYKFEIARHRQFLEDFQAVPRHNLSTLLEQAGVYVVSTPESAVRWGYIDANGRLLFLADADYVMDYHTSDSTAFYLKRNLRTALGRPDADYGLLNYWGEPVSPATYSNITRLERVFMVEVDSTPTFYFTPQGVELFVNPTRLRPFSEGLAQFMDSETKLWGYLDSTGQVAIHPAFSYARSFSEGRAIVGNQEGNLMVIDKIGRKVFSTNIPLRMQSFLGDFRSGRCWYKAPSGWLWGCYDREGKIVFEPKYYYQRKNPANSPAAGYEYNLLPMDFFAGNAVAGISVNNMIQYYLIDSLGKIEKELSGVRQSGNFQPTGYMIFKDENQKQGIINYRGKIVVPPKYTQVRPFINGFAAVKSELDRWGMVDTLGRLVLDTKFGVLDTLSDGLVKVKYPGSNLWYYVDTSGVRAFPEGFEQAANFKDNVTLVKIGDTMRIMNRKGQMVEAGGGIPREFSEGIFCMEEIRNGIRMSYFADAGGNNRFGRYFAEVTPFQQGVAGFKSWLDARRKSNFGAVNRRGVVIVPPKYRKLHIQPDGSIITNPQRFYGLMDNRGKILIPPDFDRIERYEDPTLFRIERGEGIGYVRVGEGIAKWVWELQK